MLVRNQLITKLEERTKQFVGREKCDDVKIIQKQDSLSKRQAELVKVMATGAILTREQAEEQDHVYYQVHLKYVINQSGKVYVEEELEKRKASFYKGSIFADVELPIIYEENQRESLVINQEFEQRAPFIYDRMKAVRYAERWWNDYNPAYEQFEVDCTNYISQCLHAGEAYMHGHPNRSKGWWYQNKNWSYSWSVANALKNHLGSSTIGLRAKEVKDPRELQLGDVICYDFQGDGRFDHNTIVTGKDAAGEPLVNAHTYNSRMRYWAYEDSTAYTPNIQYKMYTIIDDA